MPSPLAWPGGEKGRHARRARTSGRSQPRSTSREIDIRNRLASQPGVRLTVGPQDTGVKMQLVLQSENPDLLIATSRELERDFAR